LPKQNVTARPRHGGWSCARLFRFAPTIDMTRINSGNNSEINFEIISKIKSGINSEIIFGIISKINFGVISKNNSGNNFAII